jgi:abortive infection bacteriophage resistance protein
MIKKSICLNNSKFKDVISLYNFDAELRILLFELLKNRNKLKNKILITSLKNITHGGFKILIIDSRELVKH